MMLWPVRLHRRAEMLGSPLARSVRVAISLLALLLLTALLIHAQRADRATISGIVSDPSGNSIPGANVRIRNENTGVETPLVTNEVGAYTSPLLVLGTYSVTVERSGFKSAVRTGIEILGGQAYRVDLRLELGA